MKVFKLKYISYKNLLAVGPEPISIDLQAAHKTLITGTNGAGKSTLIEAITYALFGKPFRNIKLGQLINSVTKKELFVELTMEYSGSEFIIRRGQKPTVFEVLKDGIAMDAAASVKDFQSEFESMIGMNYASYKQVVVLGTAGYVPFMGLGAPARRKLVEDLLEVSVLSRMDEENKKAIKDLNHQLSVVENDIKHTQTQIDTLVSADERQKKLSGDNITRLEGMYNEAIGEIEKIKAENLVMSEDILKIDLPADPTEESSDAHRNVIRAESELNSVNRVLNLYSNGGSCPTCLQTLSDSKLSEKIENSKSELEKEFGRLKDIHSEIHKRKVEFLNTKNKISEIENKISSNRQIAIKHAESAKKIRSLLNEAKSESIDNSKEIEKLKASHSKFVISKSEILVERHQRSYITEMLKDSGIKGALIKRYIPMFNKCINGYLELMEADYSFTLDEEFSETIKSRGRENFSYSSFSQGEKGRIDLALMFTWRDIAEKVSGIKISCLILDEIFDSAADANGVKSITSILNTMKDSNIFIISHRDHNPEDYGQHLQMKKVGRFTVLE